MKKVDGYKVSSPRSVHAKSTTKAKAEAQMNLLRGVEHGGWKPTGLLSRQARMRRRKRRK